MYCRPATFLAVSILLACGPLLAGCRGNRLPVPGAARFNAARPTQPARTMPAKTMPAKTMPAKTMPVKFDTVRGKNVRLSESDMRPVDTWLSARNTQWIIGETVDVYASKEYFASMLTFNAKPGLVQKQESVHQGDSVITLTYIGKSYATNAMRAPRVFVGKDQNGRGLSVSARKILRIRMAKTRDPSRPVQLRIVARGKAVLGRVEEVLRRGEQLELGGALRRSAGRWLWVPVQR